MPPGGHPDAGLGFGFGQVRGLYHRPPRDLSGEKRGPRAGHIRAQHRMQPVRADDQRLGGDIALGQAQLARFDPSHLNASAQLDPVGLAGLDQYIQ